MQKDISRQLEGEICAFIRGRKNKALAVSLATSFFSISRAQIIEILTKWDLIDATGNWNNIVSTTGLEKNTMDKKQLASEAKAQTAILREPPPKPARFYWKKDRQEKLKEQYEAGASLSTIAKYFKTDEDTISKAVVRFALTRDSDNSSYNLPTIPTEHSETQSTGELLDSLAKSGTVILSPELPLMQSNEDLRLNIEKTAGIIRELQEHNDKILDYMNTNTNARWCFYELGQVDAKLINIMEVIEQVLQLVGEI